MSKKGALYICSSCGFKSIKWLGKCSQCSSWNAFEERKDVLEVGEDPSSPLSIMDLIEEDLVRYKTQSQEFDRVLGGGIVPGSVILLGGDPGIGKSTLLLQISSFLAQQLGRVLYISGEESRGQIRLRAQRLGALAQRLYILSTTDLKEVIRTIETFDSVFVVLDSVQSIHDKELSSLPGSIRQVQEVSSHLVQIVKRESIPLVLIGHVTKEGALAGPKILEHLVDTVLYLEGEHQRNYRILRGVKNRFGPTSEIGVYSMGLEGLKDVDNPSQLFIYERSTGVSGSIIIPCLEGSRPLLIEVQALVTQASFGNPRRMTSGVDPNRLVLLIAVLEKHLGLMLQDQDVHLNIPGGLKVNDVAMDLGIILAILSSYYHRPLPPQMVALGEVGLAGEIRSVIDVERRMTEAIKLGFTQLILPKREGSNLPSPQDGVEYLEITHITAVQEFV